MKWPVVGLRELAREFISGGTPDTKEATYWAGDIPWITGADVTDRVVDCGRKCISEEAVRTSATHIVPKGSILLVTRTGVGKVAKAGADIAISQDLTGIVLKDEVNADFAIAAIQQRMDTLTAIQQGSTIKGVLRKDIERIVIPLPPLSEQRRIVEILDQADALRKKRAEADAKAERILPALFYRMFGDPVRNEKGWEVLKLEHVASVRRGDFRHRPRTEPRFYGGPYPFIQINDITASNIIIRNYTQTLNEEGLAISRMFLSGTVVLSIAATIAASGILGFDSCFPDSLVGVQGVPEKATQEFLLFFFRLIAPKLAAQAPQLAQKNINLRILNDLDVPLPPIVKQKAFSRMVQQGVTISDGLESQQSRIDCLWNSLLHRAFSGDLTAKWREARARELVETTQLPTDTSVCDVSGK